MCGIMVDVVLVQKCDEKRRIGKKNIHASGAP